MSEKLSHQVSEKISHNSLEVDDQTRIMAVGRSLIRPNSEIVGLSSNWMEFASTLDKNERSITRASLGIARNYLRIPTIGLLRQVSFEDLASAHKIGEGRAKILKAFGDNLEKRMKLEDFTEELLMETEFPRLKR
jgi:hypothetical protein